MKLHNKVIILPVSIMLVIFVTSMASIEYYLKTELKRNLENKLTALASFALTSVEFVYDEDTKVDYTDPSYDLLADRIGQTNNIRVTYINREGNVLGDSDLTYSQIAATDNHINRPEIQQALQIKFGQNRRYSTTLKENMVYFATFDSRTGIFARVAVNSNIYHQTIVNLRWQFTVIIMLTVGLIIAFGLLSIHLIKKAVIKERASLEQVIAQKTRETTLIQTMTTMLNAIDCYEDSSIIFAKILPKLLPNYSGALFVKTENGMLEIVHWGPNWPEEISVLSNWRQSLNKDMTNHYYNDLHIQDNRIFAGLGNNEIDLGVFYLINHRDKAEEHELLLIRSLTEQISSSLDNLTVKTQLKNQAIRDPLTDLYNRRFMLEAFEQALNRAERQHSPLAVIMLDIDHFKHFNDDYGHDAGDLVLTSIAEIFKHHLRLADIACRYGGEEFAILCPDTDLPDAYSLAEKLRGLIEKLQLSYQDKPLGNVTISIGIAIYPIHGLHCHQLLKNADEALYRAKNNGRNCAIVSKANSSHQQYRLE